ncbi:TauD/TfdA family dioxygenase [Aureisphaera galaxeae]|uniref:TauD/TfdA family dioxygenase n=1 Tax=Aureisphaera galaxeae TaxID=1538023 RepID=UPI002350FD85|nr:TauD/TfdA family dioxygenase [Aureisphaera galaxeae]MDC8004733.1 TauD/TfdA family dioxygenase [Aureisphaera galaxeae]
MTLPFEIALSEQKSPQEFIAYYKENEQKIDEELSKYGALKFKNVAINSTEDFEAITAALSSKFLNYVNGNSPRKKLSNHVYTSTEYDKSQIITMHNEMSYSASWPKRLFLSCITVSETGGETLLADSKEILNKMNPTIVNDIKTKGIKYIRNLHGGDGFFGNSWQDTYETTNKEEIEAYLKASEIDFTWKADNSLRIVQSRHGLNKHPDTGEDVWFNQIEHFHPCHLGDEIYEVIQSVYESPLDYPMYVTYGDGSPIDVEIIEEIVTTIDSLTVAPKWNTNELLILDNERVCHGRNSFTGDRLVLVSMS